MVTSSSLRGYILRPSELGESEIAVWHQMLDSSPSLQRAFFTPAFAVACERAIGRAHVGVLHEGGTIVGFLPFQFRTGWHQGVRLAERIGGNMSDNAGVIAWPDFKTDAAALVRCCGLGSLSLSHLMEGQERLGLEADWSQLSYVCDLRAGSGAFLSDLSARNRDLVTGTKRYQRKAEKTYGKLCLDSAASIAADALAGALAMKRLQYRETQVPDPFASPSNLALMEVLKATPGQECRLVLTRLRAGDRTLAQHLGLQYKDVLSWWFPAYDRDAKGVSPGRLLLWLMIQHASNHAIGLIDYGEGEAQYKRQFSTGRLRLGRALWSASNLRSILSRVWQSAEWRLAKLVP
jgi:CelD/BcsL family acetyltransferase involved in cellulose biosynthesis